MNHEIHVGEVGFPHEHREISPTGINSLNNSCNGIKIPRLVIFEEPGSTYDIHHQDFGPRVRACDGKVFYGNIYKPETLDQLPNMGLLVLENVVTDPDQVENDWFGLLRFLELKIVPNGIVWFSDYLFPEFQYTGNPHEEIRKVMGNCSSFEILYSDPLKKNPIDAHARILNVCKAKLAAIGMMDEAMKLGFDEMHKLYWHWLILQRK